MVFHPPRPHVTVVPVKELSEGPGGDALPVDDQHFER